MLQRALKLCGARSDCDRIAAAWPAGSPKGNDNEAAQLLGKIGKHIEANLEELQGYIQQTEHLVEQDATKQWDAWVATAQLKGGKFLHRWTKLPQNNSGHAMKFGQRGPQSVEEVLETEAGNLGKL